MGTVEVPADLTLGDVWVRVQALEGRVHQLEAWVRELEESGSEFRRALNRLGDALGATHNRPAMISAVLETCALYMRASGAVFYRAVGGSDRLRPLASCGISPAPGDLGELRVGEGLAGAAAERDAVVIWPGTPGVWPAEAAAPGRFA